MPLTNSLVVFTDAVKGLIVANQDALGIYSVFYGDQSKLNGTPIVCVEPDVKVNDLHAAKRTLELTLTVQVIVYTAEVTSGEDNRRNADLLSESVETLLHQDPTVGGIVIHSYVERLTSGYANKAGTLVKANRLQFSALSQSRLPW